MSTLSFKNINKVYDNNVQAVFDFNLEIKDKEFIVFVGPSGCGKSTTLRMVAGLEEITDGELYIDGKLVNDVHPKDRDIAMVFQSYALYPHMSVYENMAFGLKIRHIPKQEIKERINHAAEILGLTEYLDRKPKALSGGQRQRVALGRAIVRNPKVFLMDEPLSNLDAKLRNQMRAEIILLRKRINTTFIYVTHDQTEAMTLGDRIVCMKDGYIMQVGTPTELFDMPANLFVAQFIGAPMMNTIKTSLYSKGGKYFVKVFGHELEVTGEKGEMLKKRNTPDREINLGVRPEHITFARDKGTNSFPVTIEVNEMMGSEYHLHVVTEDGTKLVVRIPTINLSESEREGMVMGNKINVTFEGKAMHFFDLETERNILVDQENAPEIK